MRSRSFKAVACLAFALLAFVPRVGVAGEVSAVAPDEERAQLLGGAVGDGGTSGTCNAMPRTVLQTTVHA